MDCEERRKLLASYLTAAGKINDAAGAITDAKSPHWREATRIARMESRKALRALVKHQREHGCHEKM
jgi:hypothetical protein